MQIGDKSFYGIGFKNDLGGFEIRTPFMKLSTSPKDITTFQNGGNEAAVFEGFYDFLSFKSIHLNQPQTGLNFVVLNSGSFCEKARPFMEQHESNHLYLDRDTTGQNYSRYAVSLSSKYNHERSIYRGYKDLNDARTDRQIAKPKTKAKAVKNGPLIKAT